MFLLPNLNTKKTGDIDLFDRATFLSCLTIENGNTAGFAVSGMTKLAKSDGAPSSSEQVQ